MVKEEKPPRSVAKLQIPFFIQSYLPYRAWAKKENEVFLSSKEETKG